MVFDYFCAIPSKTFLVISIRLADYQRQILAGQLTHFRANSVRETSQQAMLCMPNIIEKDNT